MTDTFNPQCPNCQITIGRIEKWIDHVGCSPRKFQRYDSLLAFVKAAANPISCALSVDTIHERAKELLQEIGEND